VSRDVFRRQRIGGKDLPVRPPQPLSNRLIVLSTSLFLLLHNQGGTPPFAGSARRIFNVPPDVL